MNKEVVWIIRLLFAISLGLSIFCAFINAFEGQYIFVGTSSAFLSLLFINWLFKYNPE